MPTGVGTRVCVCVCVCVCVWECFVSWREYSVNWRECFGAQVWVGAHGAETPGLLPGALSVQKVVCLSGQETRKGKQRSRVVRVGGVARRFHQRFDGMYYH